ncbi:MAG: septum formation initiator family protein [bacterium]|nr:septum formation initiator family protein [bacterium]
MKQRILLIIIIIIELFVIFSCLSRVFSILHSQNRIAEFKIQRDVLNKELAKKQELYDFVRTDTYIEKIAREKLGYAREGDIVYIVPTGKQQQVELPQIAFQGESSGIFMLGEVGGWWKVFFK